MRGLTCFKWIVTFAVLVTIPGFASAEKPIANLKLDAGQILFVPVESGYSGLVLTISGPESIYKQQHYRPGETPSFKAIDCEGKPLPDGVYSYELRLKPVVAGDVRTVMEAARESGDYQAIEKLQNAGKLPKYVNVQSGTFSLADGGFVDSTTPEVVNKDVLHYDDVIITGSLCVGFDCVNGESFGYCTVKLKENNLQLCFEDTSAGSFPTADWKIQINDTTSGGASYFTLWDIDSGRRPFTVEQGAPAHSLYVEDYGRIGFGTSTPYVELHIKDGDSPTLRLDQDGSSGWTAQSWDMAGNETNFFIRDVTNGSKLSFRIQPNTPSNTLSLKSDGNVGIGTWSPDAALHAVRTSGPSAKTMLHLENNGGVRFDFEDTNAGGFWRFQTASSANELQITRSGTGVTELMLDNNGNLTVEGDINSGGTTFVPDYVFSPDYSLRSIDDLAAFIAKERHLPGIPSAEEIERQGSVNLSKMQMRLLEKIEELTLYILAQQKHIEELEQCHIDAEHLKATVVEHRIRLEKLESGAID